MSIRGKAFVAGIYEHPCRGAANKTLAQLHAEIAKGAIADAGLSMGDVDAYFCAGDAPGLGPLNMIEYLGLQNVRHMDSTETGGSSYLVHVNHAAQAIAAGHCNIALITLAGRPLADAKEGKSGGFHNTEAPDFPFEAPFGANVANMYAMCAKRHMHEFGTTSEQLAWIKVAASHHAQYNENARLRNIVTVDEVLASPMIADPLHRLDCCVITDGGGGLVVVSEAVAKGLRRPLVKVLGAGEAPKHLSAGRVDLTFSGARWSGPKAFEEAGVTAKDIKYASIYDSFTITVLETIEDLGFCEKGAGGRFVSDGNLISGVGRLPFNTDGGGLCNNHPGNRGGMTKVIEAVRQVRGVAHPRVQVPNCDIALAHGTGGLLGSRMGSATLILGNQDA